MRLTMDQAKAAIALQEKLENIKIHPRCLADILALFERAGLYLSDAKAEPPAPLKNLSRFFGGL